MKKQDDTRRRIFEFLGSPGVPDAPKNTQPRLTRYDVGGLLGEGAMAMVYRAKDRNLNRTVAIKVMKDRLMEDFKARERFNREAQSMASLSHPNVVTVHDAGIEDGNMFMVMEHVEGKPLRDLMSAGQKRRGELLQILEKVARGMEAAHSAGIIHRDLKPENIIVTTEGEPKVSDFGVAHLLETNAGFTRRGAVMGTPLYMAPEQVTGDPRAITRRTDVYALGVMLYEVLTGRPPFDGISSTDLFNQTLDSIPDRPSHIRTEVPRDLETICMKCLEKDPMMRYGTAGEFGDELQRYREGHPILARPTSLLYRFNRFIVRRRAVVIASAIALVLGLVLTAWTLSDMVRTEGRFQEAMKSAAEAEDQGDYEAALKLYIRATELRVNDEKAVAGRERAEAWLADKYERDAIAKKEAEDRAAALDFLNKARPHIQRAEEYLRSPEVTYEELTKRLAPAELQIRKAIDRYEGLALNFLLQGWVQELRGDLGPAESSYRLALNYDHEDTATLLRLGRLLMVLSYLNELAMPPTGSEYRKKLTLDYAAEAAKMIERAMEDVAGGGLEEDLVAAILAFAANDDSSLLSICGSAIEKHGSRSGVEDFHWLLGLHTKGEERKNHLEAALRIRPSHYLARAGLARDLHKAGKTKEALEQLDKAIETAPNVAIIRLQRGMIYYWQGNDTKARLDFNRTIQIDPLIAQPWDFRGKIFLGKGDLEKAHSDIAQAVKVAPKNVVYRTDLSVVLRRMGRLNESHEEATKAIELDRQFGPAWLSRAETRALMGPKFMIRAQQDFRQATQVQPRLYRAWWEFAQYYHTRGHLDNAMALYTRALQIFTNHAELLTYRGHIHLARGKEKEAMTDYSNAIKSNPKFMRAWIARSTLHRNKGRLAEAEKDAEESVKVAENDWRSWRARGHARLSLSNFEGAAADFAKSSELNGSDAEPVLNRALALAYLSRFQSAYEALTQAMKLTPKSAAAFFTRARVHIMAGDKKAAAADLHKSIELGGEGWARRKDAIDMLSQLGEN